MLEPESKTYDVFISYAHDDARTSEQKAVVEAIKTAIEDALKDVLPRRWESWCEKINQSISTAYGHAKTQESKETVKSIKAAWEEVKKDVDDKPRHFSILDSEMLKWWNEWEDKVSRCIFTKRLTDEDQAIVAPVKTSIEDMLKNILPPREVFLDSEALKCGDKWNEKIHECICKCRVFVYLLSPNYLRSDYCQREKLWWAQEETKKGRLHRATQSVYYVCLPSEKDANIEIDPKITAYKEENMVVQTDDKPFFESLEEVKEIIVKDRIRDVSQRISEQVVSEDDSTDSYCSVYPQISRYFVGRVKELADLNDRCSNGHAIPVISGYAGIGKTELAVAYAYAYAENFPQGRFLVPMEGVSNWNDAMVKLVELCRVSSSKNKKHYPLPENSLPDDWDRMPPDEKREAVYKMLVARADKGRLLILLDNLEDMSLLSGKRLRELTGDEERPDDICIIATTRLNAKAPSSLSAYELFPIDELKEKDALELFFSMGDNVFPFAKYPMDNGKLLLDEIPEDKRPLQEDIQHIESEYSSLQQIVSLLSMHAWSLELVAGFMAENYGHYSFQQELEDLQESPLENLIGSTHRGEKIEQNANVLLQPSLNKLIKSNEIANKLGEHILQLATVAAFFPPDNVPEYALKGIWEQEYGNEKIVYDEGRKKAMTRDFALEQLKRYRIVNNDGTTLKMHRLTRDVLLNCQSDEDKVVVVKLMRKYWDDFQYSHPNMSLPQVRPWIDWAEKWLDKLPLMQEDKDYLWSIVSIANESNANNLYLEAERLYRLVLDNARKTKNESMTAICLGSLANLNDDLNRADDAEREYKEALSIRRRLAATNPDRYDSDVANTLTNLANLHSDLNRHDEAEGEYVEALSIRRRLAATNPDRYDSDVANTLTNLAILHSDLNRHDEAEGEYVEALSIRRRLTETSPACYDYDVASTLNNLAVLHYSLNRANEAEREYREALLTYRRLAKTSPSRYDYYVASMLNNLANLHYSLKRANEAEREYREALSIYRRLAETNLNRYDIDVASTLNNLANLHCFLDRTDEAEREYKDALVIYRRLVAISPGRYDSDVAMTLNNLASLHADLIRYDEAEGEYVEALKIYRRLAESTLGRYDSDVALTLNNLAILHKNLNRADDAEREYEEALSIRRRLAEASPDRYDTDVASTLTNLASLHYSLKRYAEAESEYVASLSIRRRLAESSPGRYDSDVASTLTNLAALHSDLNRYEDAEDEYVEALCILRRAAEISPGRYDSDVAHTLYSLASIHDDLNRTEDAEHEYKEALFIYKRLTEFNSERFKPLVEKVNQALNKLYEKKSSMDDQNLGKTSKESMTDCNNTIKNNYRVFISYAHADAQTNASKKLIASLKEQINAALQSEAKEDLVFLDSDALDWGDEWSSKIMECLQQCKVFVCLLSPNYQKSAYCKRERLMWERKEIRLGRLRKGTLPVYYIRVDNEKTEELLFSEADDTEPFFENIEQIREDIISEKIKRVKKVAEKVKNKKLVEEQASSVRYGFFHISPNFVGRLGELSELCEICNQRHIPIVTGEAGVGKSELVVAYASGYAERYPQGRFMLHMEGVEDWNHAVVKLIEDNSSAANSVKELLALPEVYEKLPIEEKRKMVVQCLWNRSKKGRLLLILDNLGKLSLVSDNGLNKLLDGVDELPENIDIIATTRNNYLRMARHVKALSGEKSDYIGLPVLYEIDNLDTASAFELFCCINNYQLPFAKYNPDCMKEDARKEYDALMEIISYFKGHAWSLAIIARLMAENTDDEYTFQCKLEEIRKTTTGIAGEDSRSNLNPALTPEKLLQPTFDCIAAMDHGCKIGVKILELVTVAAFFPPNMVSDEALCGYWKKYYKEFENVRFDAGTFAIKQLHALHMLNGDGGVSKMHRLTREVLLKRLSEEDKIIIVKQMQAYWDDFLYIQPNMTLQQVEPWIGWADEWLNNLALLRQDENFLWSIICIAIEGLLNNLLDSSEKLCLLVLENANKLCKKHLIAGVLSELALIHEKLNRYEKAESEYNESLETYRRLAENNHGRYDSDVAMTLTSLGFLHNNLNRYEEAECEYKEALSIFFKLKKTPSDRHDSDVADTLNNFACLHSTLNRTKDAERELLMAQWISHCFSEHSPELYNSYIASTLNNLAILHEKLNRYKEAESEYKEALETYRHLATTNSNRYKPYVAMTLSKLANLHKDLEQYEEAFPEYDKALKTYHSLAKTNHGLYDSYMANTLNNLADLHEKLKNYKKAESKYKKALETYRHLATTNSKRYEPYVATTLSNLANLHIVLKRTDEAELEYEETLSLRRRLSASNPECYDSDVAMTLTNLASLHKNLYRYEKAECEYVEALETYRCLVKTSPECYDFDMATTLNNFADLHEKLKRYEEAEGEYVEALSILRHLAKTSPDRYESDVAMTLNNLASLHSVLNRADDSEQEYKEALAIYRRLVKTSSLGRYDSDVALTLINLALLHQNLNHTEDAECEYKEALEIYRSLEASSPDRYGSFVADTLNKLANLYENLNRTEDAECEYKEALKIYRSLAKNTPEHYDSDVATTLTELASIHDDLSRAEDAEREYEEALDIYRRLSVNNLKHYGSYVATTLNNLANLHDDLNRPDKAEYEYKEALETYRFLAEISPDLYDSDVSLTLTNLAILHSDLGRIEEAEHEYNEALSIYQCLAKNNQSYYSSYIFQIKNMISQLQEKMNKTRKQNFLRCVSNRILGLFHKK